MVVEAAAVEVAGQAEVLGSRVVGGAVVGALQSFWSVARSMTKNALPVGFALGSSPVVDEGQPDFIIVVTDGGGRD